MQLITHQSHLDELPRSDISDLITARFQQLTEDTDVPPNIVLVESNDDITGPDYAFVDPRRLLSDLFEVHKPRHPEFARPYEWGSFIPERETFDFCY